MGKVFERVLLARMAAYVEKHSILHENQNGFRAKRSCEQHVFALQQTLEHNPNALAVFVDVRKAYPTVFRDGLFLKLAQAGVTGDIWQTLRHMYQGLTSKVAVGAETSEEYGVENGLMEGAILSPFLYTLFIDGLARKLEASGYGCRLGRAWAGALYYADDLVLLANSHSEMQKMLRVLDEYCRDWKFQPSYAKTKVLRFGTQRTNEDAEEPLYLPTMYHKELDVENNLHDGGPSSATNPVQAARKYTYLGVLMDDNARFTEHMKSKVTPAVKGARSRVYRYYATSCGLSPDGCALVLRTLVEPHLRYCAAVWAPVELPAAQAVGQRNPLPWTVTKTATEELATAYNIAVRTALGADPHTKLRAIYTSMQLPMPMDVWQTSVLGFWDRLMRMPANRLARAAYDAAMAAGPSNSFMARVAVAHQGVHGCPPPSWVSPARGKSRTADSMKQAMEAVRLREWREHVETYAADGCPLYRTMPPPNCAEYLRLKQHGQYSEEGFNILIGLRTRGHSLANAEGQRGKNPMPLAERICPRCQENGDVSVEDEAHFMVQCPTTAEHRKQMISDIAAVYDGFCLYFDGASPERQTKILLCEIPDGRLPLPAAGGVGDAQARITATRALLSFLYRAAASHPKLRMYTRPMS
jgi:hypothetical protein